MKSVLELAYLQYVMTENSVGEGGVYNLITNLPSHINVAKIKQ